MSKKKTFENSLKQLELIVEELESGTLGLDKMLELFEEGMQLTKNCHLQLKEVEDKITTILRKDDKLIEKKGISSS